MITINNIQYRNLVEQVQKNKEDIAAHYAIDRVLADFGIKIIGQLTPEAFAPILAANTPPITGEDDFGAAYAVGESDPYIFYIWTRADVATGGSHDTNYWLDIGQLAIEGIKGNPGVSVVGGEINSNYQLVLTLSSGQKITIPGSIRGPIGETGKTGPANPIASVTINPNYTATFTFDDGSAATTTKSIRGPQGEPGVGSPGPQGEPGAALYIKAIVASVNDLPQGEITDYFGAYLVGAASPYELYVPLRDNGTYHNIGPYSGGSIVNVNGIYQQVWNADTKLDKITTAGGGNKLYGINNDGEQKMYTIRTDPVTNSGNYKNQIVQYDVTSGAYFNNGLIRIAETPIERYHTASKSYVDNKFKVYQHNQHLQLTYSDESVDIYYTCYDGGVNAKGYMKTNGMTGNISGYYTTSSGNQLPIIYGEIDTSTSNMTVVVAQDGHVGTHYLDSFSIATIDDTVTRVI